MTRITTISESFSLRNNFPKNIRNSFSERAIRKKEKSAPSRAKENYKEKQGKNLDLTI